MNAINLTDGYKLDHRRQYPSNTTLVYSNWTPRSSRIQGINKVVFFGLQYFIKKYLIEEFDKSFFSKPKEEVVKQYSYYQLMQLFLLSYPFLLPPYVVCCCFP